MPKSPEFRERLQQGVLLCDGAIGTYLHQRGVPMDRSFPEQTLASPQLVESVHREYVEAGAELIKTNTYGAHRLQLERHGLADQVRKINIHGARLARQAAEGRCYIAGCVGPLGKAMEPIGSLSREDAREAFLEQIEALVEGGVDLVFIETISDLAELDVALEVARGVSDLPVVVHKTFTEDGRTLMGELPHEVVERAEAGGADVVGANCTVGPQRMLDIIERMAQRARLPLSALPTAGLPRLVDGRIDYHAEPGYMAGYARRLAEAGATMVGACCGSTPEHIAAMAEALREAEIEVRRGRVSVEGPTAEAREPVPLRERSSLADRLGRRFLVAVDLALPRSHDLSMTLDRARRLRDEAGADAVVLSDALRARLCVHPVVVASRIGDELGMESILAYSSRDKNVLGIQSDFLGAHVMGLRNILVANADPANFGDYPNATTLYDVGPVGLVRVLDSMNRGLDLAGNPIGEPTAFVPVVSGNPCAADLDAELRSLEEQVEAGAVGVVTQPMWDADRLDAFLEACAEMQLPAIVGVLPLRSSRHAEFLHNEVPGLEVPEALRRELQEAADPPAVGLRHAREFLAGLPGRAAGVHVVPPYQKEDKVQAVLAALDLPGVQGRELGARS